MDDIRLGTLLVAGGTVDEAALKRCLQIQELTGHARPLGQILVEQGHLDAATLRGLLELQRERADVARAEAPATDLASSALLQAAVANGADEMVVSEGRPVRIRVGPSWNQLTEDALGGPEVWDFVRETMGIDVLESLADQHFVVRPWAADGIGRGLAAAFRQFDGVAVRVTFAAAAALEPEALAIPAAVVDAVRTGRGLVLIVGERGIGRSETLACLAQTAATDPARHVVVVDDEPWSPAATGKAMVRRRFGFLPVDRAAALRSVLREDPDVLVVADVGDAATFEVALRAAEGGRLVIAWLEAANAVAALTRVLDFYPQHDLPRVRASLAAVLRTVLVRLRLPDANHTGSVVATELLVVDDAMRDIVRRGDLADAALLLRAADGNAGHSLDQSMLALFQRGLVRLDDVFVRAEEKAWLLERTRTVQSREE
ncbi:MAG: ATPase, T2SS/T4P/T4SS family [Planctomycetota bacterium]